MVMRKTGSAGDGDGKVTEVEHEPEQGQRKTSSIRAQGGNGAELTSPLTSQERREIVDGEG